MVHLKVRIYFDEKQKHQKELPTTTNFCDKETRIIWLFEEQVVANPNNLLVCGTFHGPDGASANEQLALASALIAVIRCPFMPCSN